ncbi:winged helix-turn-helix transcriptional regulator [Spirosoma agri]|nr:helix-turn-helix domain-containing protein [Spirosoma agri]
MFAIDWPVLPHWIVLSNRVVSVPLSQKLMLTTGGCPKTALSIKDALEALEGRWKLLILFALSTGNKRFNQLAKEVTGITDKTLSKELKSLEANKLIQRTVHATFPPTVDYSITAHGMSLENVMEALHYWGLAHRQEIIGK